MNALEDLRTELRARKLDGFFLPHSDAFRSESLRDCDKRLAYVTGFTGSAGQALILLDRAYIFVDGRYTLQAAKQVSSAFEICDFPQDSALTTLKKYRGARLNIGYDPMLMTVAEREAFRELSAENVIFTPLQSNPVDAVWRDQPEISHAPVYELSQALTGLTCAEKRAEIAQIVRENNCTAFLSANPEAGNWLMNIRGGDVANTPIALFFTLLHASGEVELFGDGDGGDVATIQPIRALLTRLRHLSDAHGDAVIGYDKAQCPVALFDEMPKGKAMADPIIARKARKTPEELAAIRHAHIVDAVAMVHYLYYIESTEDALDEVSAADKLFACRQDAATAFQIPLTHFSNSFDAISGVNGNGAIIHYRAEAKTAAKLPKDGIYLIDSGAQYPGATTDITRTIALGAGTHDAHLPFTAVLSGLANLSQLNFPRGTKGAQIDAFARAALWQHGLNYAHGTGHGVGAGLSVHEGPAAISPLNQVPLEAGMVLSIEPGFYRENEFGIRLENLVAVHENEDGFLQFETLTFVPIDTRLVAVSELDAASLRWLNDYHRHVFDIVSPYLDDAHKAWLKEKTSPISPN